MTTALGVDEVREKRPWLPAELADHLEGEVDLIGIARGQMAFDDVERLLDLMPLYRRTEWSQPVAAIPSQRRQMTDVLCFEQPKPGERCSRFHAMGLQIERETGFVCDEADRVQAEVAREP